MGLLDNKTHIEYYQGNDFGNYQFTSLDDIINQFMVAYVGENKIIPKVKRTDIAFHAQRALAELSFDVFKSVKSQQIDVPASLTMILPHDYVSYTKLSWPDSSGIKRPLYPTKHTSNPFQIAQETDGDYTFQHADNELVNNDFSDDFIGWSKVHSNAYGRAFVNAASTLGFKHKTRLHDDDNKYWGYVAVVYQELDVSDQSYVDLKGLGLAVNIADGGTHNGILRLGLSTYNMASAKIWNKEQDPSPYATIYNNGGLPTKSGEMSYIEWNVDQDGTTATTKTLGGIDVRGVNRVYVYVTSHHDFDGNANVSSLTSSNTIDDIVVTASDPNLYLKAKAGNETESSTWKSYKSITPSENNNDDYEDDTYWPIAGERYGLEPSHAQVNGSFFIDQRLGKIHFSSNLSGKAVILDYISDSLGTDDEMQVHKFAEDAMYKYIMHAVLSTSSYGQPLVPRLTKEKFAAIRKAKLRLSDIKLEELIQILRGKSKQIKH
tara:strand:- start:831 stop:2303 length:1473 start_codon:yes stop_codon:yes gene_type:complete